jgi:lipopolysaccharide export system protein LptC
LSTANRALSNADGSEVQLFGNAIVVRESIKDASGRVLPRLELRSEFLHAYSNVERVRTHLPVVMTRGNDRFTGDRMDYDNLDRILQLEGRVRGLVTGRTGAAP